MKAVNLYIEKASDDNCLMARLCADDGGILAEELFDYDINVSILARLEDSAGKNLVTNSKLIESFGSNLYNTVFRGAILAHYQSLRKSPIRLKLFFEKKELELLRIPWEFMFDGEVFLAANPKMTVTRALKKTPGNIQKNIKGKLKALAVIPSPLDLPEFYRPQAEREKIMMRKAMDRHFVSDKMELNFLERPTVRNIQQSLASEEYHILFLTAHGIYSQKERMCYLLLEDDLGNTKRVDSETIAALLSGQKSLRLVVLSGCHTGLAVGYRVLGELPLSLLFRDIPAVIVMQYSVTAQSTVMLAQQLFAGICEGLPIDLALTNTRTEILRAGHEGVVDFGSPVLYSNNPERLFYEAPI